MAVIASPERLRQEDAARARRIARDGPEDAGPVALVEAWAWKLLHQRINATMTGPQAVNKILPSAYGTV
jgi:hypothetical protein